MQKHSKRLKRQRPLMPWTTLLLLVAASSAVRDLHASNRFPAASSTLKPGSAPQTSRVKTAVTAAIPKSAWDDLQVSILGVSLPNHEAIYENHPDASVIPASVNKVFTAYTALKKLSPTFEFKTTIFVDGVLQGDTLRGNLYIKGGGDPSLVSERMWMLVNDLVRSGIRSVTGDLLVDDSYFDKVNRPDTRPKYLKDQAYNAPIGSLSFNFNTTTIYVRPSPNIGSTPIVYIDPENSYVDIVNQAKTVKAGDRNSIVVSRTGFVKGDIGDTVLIRGSIPQDETELRFYRNIVNPSLYTAHMFKDFWERREFKLGGVVKEGAVPASARKILEFKSLPLWQVVWGMNKFSNNFVADQILKTVGAENWGVPGSLEKGITSLHDALTDIGIPKNAYQIMDGSGLTRDTRVSARQIVQVLTAGHEDMALSPEFMSSFGVAGEDGTLKSRFQHSRLRSLLRAKTGSLDGVTSLAGYCPSPEGEWIAFAILLNDNRRKHGRMTQWADAVASAICDFSRRKL